MYVGLYEFCNLYVCTCSCTYPSTYCMWVLYMYVCTYTYVYVHKYVCICVHTYDHLHTFGVASNIRKLFCKFHSVQKLWQVLHNSPIVTLYTNMHSTMISHHVWLKAVECKLIKQCTVFCTNTTIFFLYIQKVQPSSIEHRSTQIWTKHHQSLNWLIYTHYSHLVQANRTIS